METKACMACKQDIKKEALKCHLCGQIQTRSANLHNKPAFHFVAIAMLTLFILWLVYYFISLSMEDPQEPIFEINDSELVTSETEKGELKVRCIATIRNPYLKRWEYFTLQAIFMDKDGKTIDVMYAKPQARVYPSFHFKGIVSGTGNATKGEYASCELSVIDADSY